ncbi:GNAT family N-acetyltransferase [Saccharothrix obliqua]|uniref:GNAT family N-acetyltransferase n=1 Tax=Saccharothrix obliqua TaxID=2861747 RepID=UPI001C606F2F|nr:GNAT family N-acetyltransferase [Saccharothrix obliqua]MBW4718832.1 GNAT family N-acetyltransferase [Saccharothrix obliqua]
MDQSADTVVLAWLDAERRALGSPGRDVVREFSADRTECRIVHATCTPDNVDRVIRDEVAAATESGYVLEWKLYGHDVPADLPRRLTAAGFVADDVEAVLVLPLDDVGAFDGGDVRTRRVRDEHDLADYAEISRASGRRDVERECRHLAAVLRETPEEMSIHIAYVGDEPAACGRVHFRPGGPHAELAGGRTKPAHRRKGLFTAVVGARLREARQRGRTHAFVDALPTSAPTLRKRGFRLVTTTQPFVFTPQRTG